MSTSNPGNPLRTHPLGLALALLCASILAISPLLGPVGGSGGSPGTLPPIPHGGTGPTYAEVTPLFPASGGAGLSTANPPHFVAAATNFPKSIYTFQNAQEQYPQVTQVSLFANATGNDVASYANVQVVFVVETTLYDGVYDPTVDDTGVNNPCNGPCEESDAVPFFTNNAGRLAQDIADNNPYSTVSFAMVDYFATINDHDDGDGAEYHVDVGNFVPASQFQSDVVTSFQDPVLSGNWYYSDSDFSDCILGSSEITALYGALKGSGLAWNPNYHHVIVIIGSTAPRDPGYVENYAYTHSDWNSGTTQTCEPSYNYGGGVSSPSCERWIQGSSSIAALANSTGVSIDYIDNDNGVTNGGSQDYTSSSGGDADATTILNAGCALAVATGGSWNGPPGYACSASETGTGQGNLTCTQGSSCFEGQNGGTYNNPPNAWSDNYPLAWAITHISFGPSSVSNVTGTSNGQPMFQFVPAQNITPDPTNPGWSVVCLNHGTPLSGCQQTPTITTSGSATVYGWAWPAPQVLLNDTWEVSFDAVAVGPPYGSAYPLDACSATAYPGVCTVTPGVAAYSQVNYKNFQGGSTTLSFPPTDITVVAPPLQISITPQYSRGSAGFGQTFTSTVVGGTPPYTYQWYVNGTAIAGATTPSFSYSFATPGTYIVMLRVWDPFPTGSSATAQVYIIPSQGAYFPLQGNITDATTGAPVGGAYVSLNGTAGSTFANTTGFYALGPLLNGTYQLYVNASGYKPASTPVTILGGTWLNVALQPQVASTYTIQGYVSDFNTSAPVAGAALKLTYYGSPFGSATSGANGYYAITGVLNSTYTLTASASGFLPSSFSVIIAGASVFQNISLAQLPPQTFYVTGQVINSVGRAPIVGATVTLNASSQTTDSTGTFTFLNVMNGTYVLTVTAAGFYSATSNQRVYGAGLQLTIPLTALPPPPPVTYAISGTVLDVVSLRPVANASIVVSQPGGKEIATVVGGTSGDYAVTGLSNGSYVAVASAPGYLDGSSDFTINGLSLPLNLYLSPVGGAKATEYTVSGVVLDAVTRAGIVDAAVNITPNGGPQTTGPGGVFNYRLTNNSYDLTVTAKGYHSYPTGGGVATFNVSGSVVDLTIALIPSNLTLYPIVGLVYDLSTHNPIRGATVSVQVPAGGLPIAPTTSSSTGGFSMLGVNGSYEFVATAAGFYPGFLNGTISGKALTGLVFYLRPSSPQGSNSESGCANGFLCPGVGGLYLQLWVPFVAGLSVFAIAMLLLRRRHRKLRAHSPGEPAEPGMPAEVAPSTPPPGAP